MGEPSVSYLLKSDQGSMLYDVGFGADNKILGHNATKMDLTMNDVDALAISHPHSDHVGGIKPQRSKQVRVPEELWLPYSKPCFLPDKAGTETELFRAGVTYRL